MTEGIGAVLGSNQKSFFEKLRKYGRRRDLDGAHDKDDLSFDINSLLDLKMEFVGSASEKRTWALDIYSLDNILNIFDYNISSFVLSKGSKTSYVYCDHRVGITAPMVLETHRDTIFIDLGIYSKPRVVGRVLGCEGLVIDSVEEFHDRGYSELVTPMHMFGAINQLSENKTADIAMKIAREFEKFDKAAEQIYR